MIENIFSGLILTGVTGLAVLAFKYPTLYQRVYWPFVWICHVIVVGIAIWHFAVQFTFLTLRPFLSIEGNAITNAQNAADTLALPFFLAFGIYLAAVIYLHVLAFLFQGIGKEKANLPTSRQKRR